MGTSSCENVVSKYTSCSSNKKKKEMVLSFLHFCISMYIICNVRRLYHQLLCICLCCMPCERFMLDCPKLCLSIPFRFLQPTFFNVGVLNTTYVSLFRSPSLSLPLSQMKLSPFFFVGVSSTTSSPVSVRNEILTDERSLKRQPHTLPLVLFWFILSLNGSHLYELEYFIEDAIRVSIQCGLFPAYAELTQHPVGSQSSSTLPLPSIYTR